MFCSKILPGVRVIIVNPETRGPLGDSHLGEVSSGKVEAQLDDLYSSMLHLLLSLFYYTDVEFYLLCFQIWVSSSHNASGYYTIYGEESLQADHFNTKLSFGDPQTLWARTGYLGFIKRTELLDASGGERTFNLSSSGLVSSSSNKHLHGNTLQDFFCFTTKSFHSSLLQIAMMPCLWWAPSMKRWS